MSVSIRRVLSSVRVRQVRSVCAALVGKDPDCRGDIAASADRLIARFREQAYYEARERAVGRCIDGAGSARHWTAVKLEIARRQRIAIGLAGADLRA